MPTAEEISACRESLERIVDLDCRAGVYDVADILEAIEEIIEVELGEPSPALTEELASRVRSGLEARAREEATWRERTVNDRLDSAFDDLDARGILTAQALGSTLQEGACLLDDRRDEQGGVARGSVFYHRQDLEDGVEGEGLCLAFTGYRPEADGSAAIGVPTAKELIGRFQSHHLAAATPELAAPPLWPGFLQRFREQNAGTQRAYGSAAGATGRVRVGLPAVEPGHLPMPTRSSSTSSRRALRSRPRSSSRRWGPCSRSTRRLASPRVT